MNFSNTKADQPAPPAPSRASRPAPTASTDRALKAIDRALEPVSRRVEVHVPPGFVARFCRDIRGELLTQDEESQWTDICASFAASQTAYLELCNTDPKAEYLRQQENFRERMNAGRTSEIHAVDAWSAAEFDQDRRTKIKAAKGERKRIAALALPLGHAVARRISARAMSEAATLRQSELEDALEWSIPLSMSPRLVFLEALALNAVSMVPEIPASPVEILNWAGINPL